MELRLLAKTDNALQFYENHTHFHKGDSGIDLFCLEDIIVKANTTILIDLGVACSAKNSDGYCSFYLYPRSSISKTPLRMSNSVGIIDAGYRGNLMVSVDNIYAKDFLIKKGQRLFQVCSPTLSPITFILVNSLSRTTRGSNGFGSTG